MTRTQLISFISLLLLTSSSPDWGFYGHQKINKMAVFTLPSEMIGFYKLNIDFISFHAVDPDKRRYALKNEFSRHYIDIDHWDTLPFNKVPKELPLATMKYGKLTKVEDQDTIALQICDEHKLNFYYNNIYEYRYDTNIELLADSLWGLQYVTPEIEIGTKIVFQNELVKYGVLPYFLEEFHKRLTRAFLSMDSKAILRISTDIGHYIGDAHVPLHTTVNYNGQLTNQLGLHAFWESRLPELYADAEYDFLVGKAEYIEDIRSKIWNVIAESHGLLDLVLKEEKKIQQNFPRDKQFCFDLRNDRTVYTQCQEYSKAYHLALKGTVERQMQKSIKCIGDFWYTAWVDAGQPQINSLTNKDEENAIGDKRVEYEKAYAKGEIIGRIHSK